MNILHLHLIRSSRSEIRQIGKELYTGESLGILLLCQGLGGLAQSIYTRWRAPSKPASSTLQLFATDESAIVWYPVRSKYLGGGQP